jgi:DNA helicase-2/ATP-dependent DNA helicase PcrA
MISDMVDALLLISDNLPVDGSIDLIVDKLNNMFDDHAKTVKLSTIHKSKGKEWNRVFWYGLNRYQPSPFARQEWQLEAEENLCYVAATRSKDTLVFVDAPTKEEEQR